MGDFDTVLELCRDRHCRTILAVLEEEQRSLTVSDLLKSIVKYNHHTPIDEISGDHLTEIEISLHHVHIPKLEENEVIDYDQERQLVEPSREFDQLQPHLSAIINADPTLNAPIKL